MIRKIFLTSVFSFTLFTTALFSQELPFADISKTESEFTSGNIAARMVEGLGFRYYWASESLRPSDLEFRPSEEGRSALETIQHLYDLSGFILGFMKLEGEKVGDRSDYTLLRRATLTNLEIVSNQLKGMNEKEFAHFKMTRPTGDLTFWQMINGPIADAIYHTGQLVMMRRMSDNPIAEGVNVLMGTKN